MFKNKIDNLNNHEELSMIISLIEGNQYILKDDSD